MDRRKFLQMAGVGAASPFFNLEALAQGSTDRVLIVTEMTPNSLDTHTVGANRGAYGVVWMTYDRLITFGTEDASERRARATTTSVSSRSSPRAGSSRPTTRR